MLAPGATMEMAFCTCRGVVPAARRGGLAAPRPMLRAQLPSCFPELGKPWLGKDERQPIAGARAAVEHSAGPRGSKQAVTEIPCSD